MVAGIAIICQAGAAAAEMIISGCGPRIADGLGSAVADEKLMKCPGCDWGRGKGGAGGGPYPDNNRTGNL